MSRARGRRLNIHGLDRRQRQMCISNTHAISQYVTCQKGFDGGATTKRKHRGHRQVGTTSTFNYKLDNAVHKVDVQQVHIPPTDLRKKQWPTMSATRVGHEWRLVRNRNIASNVVLRNGCGPTNSTRVTPRSDSRPT